MEHIYTVASLWLGLAVISAIIAYHLRVSIALVEICVGVAAAAATASLGKGDVLGANLEWLRFLASTSRESRPGRRVFNLNDDHHILFSAGSDIAGDNRFAAYLGYQ